MYYYIINLLVKYSNSFYKIISHEIRAATLKSKLDGPPQALGPA
jgi:hypothetical protein